MAEPEALRQRLRRTVDRTLGEVLPQGGPCALLDFPAYSNVGDSLIWLGQQAALRRHGMRIAYASDHRAFDAARLRRRLPHGPILLSGGGNFGELWPARQKFRERILEEFRDRHVVQLPQSLCYRHDEHSQRTRRLVEAHPRFTVLVRDEPSLTLARNRLGADARLCPDMIFATDWLPQRPPVTEKVVWLARTDHEAAVRTPGPTVSGISPVDWVRKDRALVTYAMRRLTRWVSAKPPLADHLHRLLEATFEPAATRRAEFGVQLLGKGRVVVTDRLHGFLLSLLLGIPHVVLDNSYGKVTAHHRCWTRDSSLTHVAENVDQALALARDLAGS